MTNWGTIDKNGIFCWHCGSKIYPQESYPYTLITEEVVRICEDCYFNKLESRGQ